MWAHITACLSVDTCWNEPKPVLRKKVRKVLKNAPKITGSEGDADVFINIQSGYNSSVSCDCDHCKFGPSIIHLKEGGFTCDGPEDYTCPDAKFQTCIVISVQGDLRDRDRDTTTKEFCRFVDYLKEFFIIRDYSWHIEGE